MYQQFFLLFAIIFTGYILRKIDFIGEEMDDGLNRFICYFAFPCLLVQKIGNLEMDGLTREFMTMFFWSLVMFALYGLLSYLYAKVRRFPPRAANVAELSMAAPNNGFMGIPMSFIFFGEKGLFLMMAHNVVLNIYFFTYSLATLRRNNENKEKMSLKRAVKTVRDVLLNPNIVAIIIGFIIAYSGVPLDNLAGEYMNAMGDIATPMAMIYIGSTLAAGNFLDMFRNHIVWESSMNKLIIFPLITLGISYFLPVSPLIKGILVLGSCFPAGATISMLAQQEKQNAELSSKILFFTTMISMVTIPLTVKLIHMTVL
ncbi:MAG: AEC family transporter [Anaerovoracaceae bacterium]|jgi:predicted permease